MWRSKAPAAVTCARPITEKETRIQLIQTVEGSILVLSLLLVFVLLLGG